VIRSYTAAAFRHLARNRIYSAISVLGLAVGVSAAILAGIVIYSELHQDQFFDGYDRTYHVITVATDPGRPTIYGDSTSSRLQVPLSSRFVEVEGSARFSAHDVWLHRDSIESKESVVWADPNFFDVVPMPVVAGDLHNALRRPDGIVLTRTAARRYFGRDDAVGRTLSIQLPKSQGPKISGPWFTPYPEGTFPVTVTAVIEDVPGTQFESSFYASGLAAYSSLNYLDKAPANSDTTPFILTSVMTFVRLKLGASLAGLRAAIPELGQYMVPGKSAENKSQYGVDFVRVDAMHSHPKLNPALPGRLQLTASIGALILFIACVNFVNLLTARSGQRAKEVAIRKATGAGRNSLVSQFIGESLIYVVLATILGLALAEWLLPYVDTYLDFSAATNWWRHPVVFAWIGVGVVLLAVLAGLWPALVLSSFRPISVLNGLRTHASGTDRIRQGLVTLQFAILIGLLIVAGMVWEQRRYATTEALRVQTDQMVLIRGGCSAPLVAGLRALAGVRGAACSGADLINEFFFTVAMKTPDGVSHQVSPVTTQPQVLDLLGIRPLAGDWPHTDPIETKPLTVGRYILNETAVREFGFKSPRAALGQVLDGITYDGEPKVGTVVAVVPDFSTTPRRTDIPAQLYFSPAPDSLGFVDVKLDGRSLPETLGAIDRLWRRLNPNTPMDRFFLDDRIEALYRNVLRQAQAFSLFSGIAALLACLGLAGLASSVVERRTREIGVRKAMGAETRDVVYLLLWRFSKPVVWANLIAWPVAGYLMNRWLHTFSYHTTLQAWLFAAAGAGALLLALVTVSAHSLLVARASPVTALRYE
jgi:putative ABC transport system permease protein